MVEAAIDREAGLLEIEIGHEGAHPLAIQQDRIVALVDNRIAAPCRRIALTIGMEEVDDPALRMYDVVIQITFHLFPQLEGVAVKL